MTVVDLYGHERLCEVAGGFLSRIGSEGVVGFGMVGDGLPDWEGLVSGDPAWQPFAGVRAVEERTVLVVPGYRTGSDRVNAIRLLAYMECEFLLTTGACTALRQEIPEQALALISDHLNLSGQNPLVGPNDDRVGPRFSGMTEPYDKKLLNRAADLAIEGGIVTHRCVLAGLGAPPTPAECRYLAYTGADVYGSGITSDTIVANHVGLPVVAAADVIARRTPEGPDSLMTDGRPWDQPSGKLYQMIERIIESLRRM